MSSKRLSATKPNASARWLSIRPGQAARDRVTHQRDEGVEKIVASWPGRIDNQRALALGFVADKRFDDIIERFRQDDMEGRS
ncbi:hypothetical protein ABA47_4275 [Salmonella enterica subsp. enterica serovar Enteritidis]|uniref:Uncharacterized protein n=1 Tax=Salmonella enteritidis TaxID=149539 RepID=A0A1X8W578_SALEN|nr:hypothetical protein ABA47_4275 [Salmonella enterica subsp. enterica serovar Enteritidis]